MGYEYSKLPSNISLFWPLIRENLNVIDIQSSEENRFHRKLNKKGIICRRGAGIYETGGLQQKKELDEIVKKQYIPSEGIGAVRVWWDWLTYFLPGTIASFATFATVISTTLLIAALVSGLLSLRGMGFDERSFLVLGKTKEVGSSSRFKKYFVLQDGKTPKSYHMNYLFRWGFLFMNCRHSLAEAS